jgi:DNA-binding MarR family transcriptional regulator
MLHIQLKEDILQRNQQVPNRDETRATAALVAEQCIGARVRMLNRTLTRLYDDALRNYGIRFSQMNILTIIALRGPIQPAEIVRVLALEKSTVSRNARLMEDNGWIRSRAGESGNSQLLEITNKGAQLYKKAAVAWQTAQQDPVALLGDRGTQSIRRATDRAMKT